MIWPGKNNYITPAKIEDSIRNAMWVLGLPAGQAIEKLPTELKLHVKDFLSQKFAAEMMREGADSEALERLWKTIFPEGGQGAQQTTEPDKA